MPVIDSNFFHCRQVCGIILIRMFDCLFFPKENKKIVHGKIALSNEEMQKELLEPTTMLYGELAEKDGYVKMFVYPLKVLILLSYYASELGLPVVKRNFCP